jgi:hypothetical protein
VERSGLHRRPTAGHGGGGLIWAPEASNGCKSAVLRHATGQRLRAACLGGQARHTDVRGREDGCRVCELRPPCRILCVVRTNAAVAWCLPCDSASHEDYLRAWQGLGLFG